MKEAQKAGETWTFVRKKRVFCQERLGCQRPSVVLPLLNASGPKTCDEEQAVFKAIWVSPRQEKDTEHTAAHAGARSS